MNIYLVILFNQSKLSATNWTIKFFKKISMKKFLLLTVTVMSILSSFAQSDIEFFIEGRKYKNDATEMIIQYGNITSLNTMGLTITNKNGVKFYFMNCDRRIASDGSFMLFRDCLNPENGSGIGEVYAYKNKFIIVNSDGKLEFNLINTNNRIDVNSQESVKQKPSDNKNSSIYNSLLFGSKNVDEGTRNSDIDKSPASKGNGIKAGKSKINKVDMLVGRVYTKKVSDLGTTTLRFTTSSSGISQSEMKILGKTSTLSQQFNYKINGQSLKIEYLEVKNSGIDKKSVSKEEEYKIDETQRKLISTHLFENIDGKQVRVFWSRKS